ncbi:MAG: hypothetical protein A3K19_19670 [Lentisphaerae bacterium RIFOXYB12_FULL_65_16]|nr:MAG: hypothetical protein A3K18_31145 [Lentisphaerae bacterium RIFOXYA12_64_32]OGV92082.1 MAG: hypothetical protein A3K19_19670 [Lentisphaerae bacterium RIFOXYB12_FULL_65_16]
MGKLVRQRTEPAPSSGLDALLGQLRALIQDARRQALRAVDAVQVCTCWEIGREIRDAVRHDLGGTCSHFSQWTCLVTERC